MRIAYHRDAGGLAINVKVYHLDSVTTLPRGTDDQRELAWNKMQRLWWGAASDLARANGFRGVLSCGRIGGWLFTTPLPEPTDDGEPGDYPTPFLDGIQTLLKAAPSMFQQALDEAIQEDAAEEAAAATPPAEPDYYVQRIPVLSTVHISESTAELLATMAASDTGDVIDTREGFLVWIGNTKRPSDCLDGMPADIAPLVAWYDAEGFDDGWLRLDGGIGSVIDGLPQYDW